MKRPGFSTLIVCVLIGTYAEAQKPAAGEHWIATWGTAQQLFRAAGPGRGGQPPPARGEGASTAPAPVAPPTSAPAAAPSSPAGRGGPQRRFGIPPSLPGLNNQTVRMIVRVSVGGSRLRLRLFNALGGGTVAISAAHVAVRGNGAAVVPGTDRPLTFSGMSKATLYAGQVLVSDAVKLDVQPLADGAVGLYLPGDSGARTSHTFGLRPAYVSRVGDFTAAGDIA